MLPSNCEVYGSSLALEDKHGNLGYWQSEDDEAVWSVAVPHTGKYAVWLDWSCSNPSAGNSYILHAGLSRLTGRVESTGGWDNYKQARVGVLTLREGQQQIVFRPGGKIKGSLIDLKSIRLVPEE
jgi:hypothetical protein